VLEGFDVRVGTRKNGVLAFGVGPFDDVRRRAVGPVDLANDPDPVMVTDVMALDHQLVANVCMHLRDLQVIALLAP
jgi:hypothetical protein